MSDYDIAFVPYEQAKGLTGRVSYAEGEFKEHPEKYDLQHHNRLLHPMPSKSQSGRTLPRDIWYHGTTREFAEFGDPTSLPSYSQHWNALLGPHFAHDPEVAGRFAADSYQYRKRFEQNTYGAPAQDYAPRVVPVRLNIRNPKRFQSEAEMDEEALMLGLESGEIDPYELEADEDTPYAKIRAHIRGKAASFISELAEQRMENYEPNEDTPPGYNPFLASLADSFKSHYRARGHDGVIYKNEVEGGWGAIPFDVEQIEYPWGKRSFALSEVRSYAHALEGRAKWGSLDISLEHLPGSTRQGVDPNGHPWSTTFSVPYGYIRGTEGVDGDHIDCFLGPLSPEEAPTVYVVMTRNPQTGAYDEDKLFLGFPDEQTVLDTFRQHYDNPLFLGGLLALSASKLQEWVASGELKDRQSLAEKTRNYAHQPDLRLIPVEEHRGGRIVSSHRWAKPHSDEDPQAALLREKYSAAAAQELLGYKALVGGELRQALDRVSLRIMSTREAREEDSHFQGASNTVVLNPVNVKGPQSLYGGLLPPGLTRKSLPGLVAVHEFAHAADYWRGWQAGLGSFYWERELQPRIDRALGDKLPGWMHPSAMGRLSYAALRDREMPSMLTELALYAPDIYLATEYLYDQEGVNISHHLAELYGHDRIPLVAQHQANPARAGRIAEAALEQAYNLGLKGGVPKQRFRGQIYDIYSRNREMVSQPYDHTAIVRAFAQPEDNLLAEPDGFDLSWKPIDLITRLWNEAAGVRSYSHNPGLVLMPTQEKHEGHPIRTHRWMRVGFTPQAQTAKGHPPYGRKPNPQEDSRFPPLEERAEQGAKRLEAHGIDLGPTLDGLSQSLSDPYRLEQFRLRFSEQAPVDPNAVGEAREAAERTLKVIASHLDSDYLPLLKTLSFEQGQPPAEAGEPAKAAAIPLGMYHRARNQIYLHPAFTVPRSRFGETEAFHAPLLPVAQVVANHELTHAFDLYRAHLEQGTPPRHKDGPLDPRLSRIRNQFRRLGWQVPEYLHDNTASLRVPLPFHQAAKEIYGRRDMSLDYDAPGLFVQPDKNRLFLHPSAALNPDFYRLAYPVVDGSELPTVLTEYALYKPEALYALREVTGLDLPAAVNEYWGTGVVSKPNQKKIVRLERWLKEEGMRVNPNTNAYAQAQGSLEQAPDLFLSLPTEVGLLATLQTHHRLALVPGGQQRLLHLTQSGLSFDPDTAEYRQGVVMAERLMGESGA